MVMVSSPTADIQNEKITKFVVLHVIPNGDLASGGLAYASIRLAHEQARAGVLVYVLEVDSQKHFIAPWWCDNVKYIDFHECRGVLRRIVNLLKFLVKYRPVVHFHGVWYPQYFPYFLLALLTNRPFIISPHGNLEPGALKQKFLKKYLARKLYFDRIVSRAAALWACSEKELTNLKREFPKVRAEIVSIGVDIPPLTVAAEVDAQIDQCKVMLVVSRLSPGKGLLNLVYAWNLIQDEGWRIIIAGPDENNYQKKIELEIGKLNLPHFFSFPGYIDTKQRDALYRHADIFVLPSLSENFGIVVAEAMSYGVPVLTTNETPWTYVGLERGCLCVGTAPSEIAQGLRTIMNLSEDDIKTVGKAARLFISKNFTWNKIAQNSKIQLKKLLKSSLVE